VRRSGTSIGFVGVMLVLPLAVVFAEAMRSGVAAYFAALSRPSAWQAIRLTLPDRAAGAQLPSVQVVDLRTVMREAVAARTPQSQYEPAMGVLSPLLSASIEARLVRGERHSRTGSNAMSSGANVRVAPLASRRVPPAQ